jgi:hypothetical protein
VDELIDRVASATGLDAATARQAVVLIWDLWRKKARLRTLRRFPLRFRVRRGRSTPPKQKKAVAER